VTEGLEALEERCRQAGLPVTAPRRAVLAALAAQTLPADAIALLMLARRHHARASIGTVYRFMRELERCGLVRAHSQAHGRIHWQWGDMTAPPANTPDAVTVLRQIAERMGYRLIRNGGDFIY